LNQRCPAVVLVDGDEFAGAGDAIQLAARVTAESQSRDIAVQRRSLAAGRHERGAAAQVSGLLAGGTGVRQSGQDEPAGIGVPVDRIHDLLGRAGNVALVVEVQTDRDRFGEKIDPGHRRSLIERAEEVDEDIVAVDPRVLGLDLNRGGAVVGVAVAAEDRHGSLGHADRLNVSQHAGPVTVDAAHGPDVVRFRRTVVGIGPVQLRRVVAHHGVLLAYCVVSRVGRSAQVVLGSQAFKGHRVHPVSRRFLVGLIDGGSGTARDVGRAQDPPWRRGATGDVVLAHPRQSAVAGIDLLQRPGIVIVVRQTPVGVQIAVRTHRNILDLVGRIPHAGHDVAGRRVHRPEGVVVEQVQLHVPQGEGTHVRRQRDRVGDIQDRVRFGIDFLRGKVGRHDGIGIAGSVTHKANVVLDNAPDGIHGFQTNLVLAARGQERGRHRGRQPIVRHHRHVIRRRLRGDPRRQIDAADERVKLARRAAGEVVQVQTLARLGLVVLDVGFAGDGDQRDLIGHGRILSEDRDGRVGPRQTVCVIEIEDQRKRLAAVGQARGRLDEVLAQRKAVPVHIVAVELGERTADADNVAFTEQQVAQVLRAAGSVVGGVVDLAGLGQQIGMRGKPDDLDPIGRIADVGIAHGRGRLLVRLPQTDLQLVAARRQTGPQRRAGGRLLIEQGDGGIDGDLLVRAVVGDGQNRVLAVVAPAAVTGAPHVQPLPRLEALRQEILVGHHAADRNRVVGMEGQRSQRRVRQAGAFAADADKIRPGLAALAGQRHAHAGIVAVL